MKKNSAVLTVSSADAADTLAKGNPVPKWAEDLTVDQFISYATRNKSGEHLNLFDEYIYQNKQPNLPEVERNMFINPESKYEIDSNKETINAIRYYVYDPIAHGADPKGKYPVILWFHGSGNSFLKKALISAAGAEYYATAEYQENFGPAYIICPAANEVIADGPALYMNWSTRETNTDHYVYSPILKCLIDNFIEEHQDNVTKLCVAGGSAGGLMALRFALDYLNTVSMIFVMAPAYLPTKEELDHLEEAGFPILYIKSRHDELILYKDYTEPIEEKLNCMSNMTTVISDWNFNGDGGISSLPGTMEMGQHCIQSAVVDNCMFNDGTPMYEQLSEGITGWLRTALKTNR